MSQTTTLREPAPASPAPLPKAPAAVKRRSAFWLPMAKFAPTAVVVGALAGLALWGHSTDWKMPKFSALFQPNDVERDDWCVEHAVPDSQCIECNKALVPRGPDYGWCKEHGVAQCPLEHPDVAQLKIPPAVSADRAEQAQRALALLPRAENNSRCKLHERRIQFASVRAIEKVGVDIAIVQERPIVEAVRANGEISYDQTHTARLASRVAGTVWRVEAQAGDKVQKGDVLALVDAASVGSAKSELLQSLSQVHIKQANVARLQPLAGDGAISGRQFRDAAASLEEAKIRLQAAEQALANLGLLSADDRLAEGDRSELTQKVRQLGLPPDLVATFDEHANSSNLFPLRAPLDGVVVERNVVAGEVVDTSATLFEVADVERMWLTLAVRPADAKYLALGQTVHFRPTGGGGDSEITGSLAWISTSADDETRAVKVRANLPNAEGQLRAMTFGNGRIVLREEAKATVVPSEAVHWDGCCHIVFVRDKDFLREDAPKFFHIRKVRPGVKEGEFTEIIAGLLPGEVIASKNSVVLEAELLKGNLGAGCCEACTPKK